MARVVPVVRAIRAALPEVPISIDTTRAAVAEAAVTPARTCSTTSGAWTRKRPAALRCESGLPIVLMHNRNKRATQRRRRSVADLARALDRACRRRAWDNTIVDPGIGFGKTAEQNLAALHDLKP